MSSISANEFELTTYVLDSGLRVEHIATSPLHACGLGDLVEEVLNCPKFADFDQIPVESEQEIAGVLLRGEVERAQRVRESIHFRPLRGSMLISNRLPLSTCVSHLRERGAFRLVIRDDRIDGIVTASDLLKLPARLLAFARITYLEMLMRERLVECCSDHEDWESKLTTGRRANIERKRRQLSKSRVDPLSLDLTDFCDKRELVKQFDVIPAGSTRSFEEEMKVIERLRNKVAHASDYADDREDLTTFIDTLGLLDKWIASFSNTSGQASPN